MIAEKRKLFLFFSFFKQMSEATTHVHCCCRQEQVGGVQAWVAT